MISPYFCYSFFFLLVSCLSQPVDDIFIIAPYPRKSQLRVLDNDVSDSNSSACILASKPPSLIKGAIHFTDVTDQAGVLGSRPQKMPRTSPNCLFDQYDKRLKAWDSGTFCIPELLTGGAASGDLNGDGLEDLYIARMDSSDSLFLNRGDGTFSDASISTGVAALTQSVRSNGIALLDIDNDGDLDVFISTLGDTRMYLLVNNGAGGFTEEAIVRGVALARSPHLRPGEGGRTSSFSIAVGDYDGDGWLDMYTTEWFPRQHHLKDTLAMGSPADIHAAATCVLFRNLGSNGQPGHFKDMTLAAGIETKTRGVRHTLESWMSDENQLELLAQLARFGVREPALSSRLRDMNTRATAYFPASDEVDTMMADVLSKLMKQARPTNAPFKTAMQTLFPYVGVFTFCARFVDLNSDGRPELVISGDFGTSQLYWNRGNGTFERGYYDLLWDLFDNSMGASVGDVNGDGAQDLLFMSLTTRASARVSMDKFYPQAGIAASFEGNHLYLNSPNRQFVEVSAQAGVKDTGWAWGGVLFDYDNDGWLDLAVTNGMDDPETTDDDFAVNTPNAAFRSTTGSLDRPVRFTPVGAQLGLDDKRDGRAYFELDYDGDGDLDLFLVNHADYPVLYRNDGGDANPWLRVRAFEAACAPPAPISCSPRISIGAVVTVEAVKGGRVLVREVGSAASFLSQGDLTAHFGLGSLFGRDSRQSGNVADVSVIYRVVIKWPSHGNASRIFRNVPARSLLEARAPRERGAQIEEDLATEALPACDALKRSVSSISKASIDSSVTSISNRGQYISYNPPLGFSGTDNFTYTLRSGETANVKVHVNSSIQTVLSVKNSNMSTLSSIDTSILNSNPMEVLGANLFASPYHVPGNGVSSLIVFLEAQRLKLLPTERPAMRPFAGTPNRKDDPLLGAADTTFIRVAPAGFDDAFGESLAGEGRRPSARAISNVLFSSSTPKISSSVSEDITSTSDKNNSNSKTLERPLSTFAALFLAFVQHDMSNEAPLAFARMQGTGADARFNIEVPRGDLQLDAEGHGGQVLPFTRAPALVGPSWSGAASRERVRNGRNSVSHLLDLETLYGKPRDLQRAALFSVFQPSKVNSNDESKEILDACGSLRLESGGSTNEPMLPLSTKATGMVGGTSFGGAINGIDSNDQALLYQAGDERANLAPGLIMLHTLFAREHNRVHSILAANEKDKENDGAIKNDEDLMMKMNIDALPVESEDSLIKNASFQTPEAIAVRRCSRMFARVSSVMRAQIQAILWNELLPALVGPFIFATLPPFAGFNASVDPSVSVEFASAVAATWHSMLRDEVQALTPTFSSRRTRGVFAGKFSLRDSFFTPMRSLRGGLDPLVRGAWAQRAQSVGLRYCDSVRLSFLGDDSSGSGKKKEEADMEYGGSSGGSTNYGLDLAALDVQRGRDLGLPSYSSLRQALGLANKNIESLPGGDRILQIYNGNNSEVDLIVALLLEPHVPGGAIGETTAALLVEQLLRTRSGDRFWLGEATMENNPSLIRDLIAVGVDMPLTSLRMADLISKNTAVDIEGKEIELFYARPADVQVKDVNKRKRKN
jgi:hypothetical protein